MVPICHASVFKPFASFTQSTQNGNKFAAASPTILCASCCATWFFNVFLSLYSGIVIYTVISGINAFGCVTSHIRGGGGCKYFLIFSSLSIQYLLRQKIMSIAGGSVSEKRYIIEKWKSKWLVVIA